MDLKDRISILEALLLISPKPIKIKDLVEVYKDGSEKDWEEALFQLEKHINEEHLGIMVQRVASSIRLVSRPQMETHIKEFLKQKSRQTFTKASLEVLAIIAYHQPITLPEINSIRGVSSEGIVKNLLDRRLIKILGRKKVVGKPFLFGTTDEFLVCFGLNSLKDLPKIEEFDAFKIE